MVDLAAYEKSITNQNAKEYLDKSVFGDVREAMKTLLDYIQESGELEKYWSIVEKENEDARRAARRLEKERKRLELGSDYQSSEGGDVTPDDYYDEQFTESEDESDEDSSDEDDLDMSTSRLMNETNEDESAKMKKKQTESVSVLSRVEPLPFNAVRFLGEAIKRINEERKLQKK